MPPRRKAQPVLEGNEDMASTNDTPPQLSPKKRGRPAKAASKKSVAPVATPDLSPAQAAPSKRKRGQTITTDNEGDVQAPKRTRAGASKASAMAKPAMKFTAKTLAQPTATRSLPEREGRNTHPGAVKGAGPAARRSSQQVAADRDATKKAVEKKRQKADEAKARLAEMHLAEEVEDEEMHTESFQSGVKNGRQAESGNSDGEDFDFDDASSTEEEEGEETRKKPATKIKKTAGKSSKKKDGLRDDVDGLVEKGRGKQKERLPTANIPPPKKYQNGGMLTPAKGTKPRQNVMVESRGLEDDNINQERPNFLPSPAPLIAVKVPTELKRDTSRKNNLVTAAVKDGQQANAAHNTREKRTVKQVGRTTTNTSRPIQPSKSHPKAKNDSSDEDDKIVDAGTAKWIEEPAWKKIFLPTLYHVLFISEQPFLDFQLESSSFLKIVQDVFDLAYPNDTVALQMTDGVVKLANRRLNEKKSKLASGILTKVKEHMDSILDDPFSITERRNLVLWSVRPDGPAFWSKPTPIGCTSKTGQPGYKKPEGMFETEIIESTARQFLGYADKSHLWPKIGPQNPPKGLYALILTAVERAFLSFLPQEVAKVKPGKAKPSRVKKGPAKFSYENFGPQLQTFVRRVEERVSERRWKEILACLVGDDLSDAIDSQDDNDVGDLTMISVNRGDFPSSPMKA